MARGTIALHSAVPFPTFISGTPPITAGVASTPALLAQLPLEPETGEIIAFSPIPVTQQAALIINRAVLAWKQLGVTGAALQVRVNELQAKISNGYALWSQYGVSSLNEDNSTALNNLPTNVLILADTFGNIYLSQRWVLQSDLWIVSDQSIPIIYSLPTTPALNFADAPLCQLELKNPTGPYPFLSNIYLFGLNFICSDVDTQVCSVCAFNANNVQILWMTATQYASFVVCLGSNIEIAYCTGTTSGALVPGRNGGPAIRVLGMTAGTTPAVPSNPGWPIVPGTSNPASLWVHNNNLQSYDGVFQLSPNNHGWGFGFSFVDVLVENSTFVSNNGPFILIGTNVSSTILTPFSYNITNAACRNLNGSSTANPFYLLHGNNPNRSWSNMLFQNITVDATTTLNAAPGVRVFCFGNVVTPIAPSISNMTLDTITMTGIRSQAMSIEGDFSTTPSILNLLVTNCSFSVPTAASAKFTLSLQGSISNAQVLNCSFGTLRNGFDIGRAYGAFGRIIYGMVATPIPGDTLTLNGTVCPFVAGGVGSPGTELEFAL